MSQTHSVLARGAVALITGGARGIGLATARAFRERGARVAICDIDARECERGAQAIGASAYTLDVRSRAAFDAVVAQVEEDLGPISILVNNAGIMPVRPFLTEKDDITRSTIDINLLGPIFGLRAVLPKMIERKRGHVVNVASMAGKISIPGLSVYCASKFALVGLAEAVRDELDGTGVTLSTVLPGAVRTDLISAIAKGGGLPLVTPERVANAIMKSCDRPRAEIPVPSFLALYEPIAALVPSRVMKRIRLLLDQKRLFRTMNERHESHYERTIEERAKPLAN